MSVNSKVTIYSNPVTNGMFNIWLDAVSVNKQLTVVVTDIAGKKVLQNCFVSNGNSQQINTGKLPAGTYLVNVLSEKSSSVSKIVVGTVK